MEIFKLIASSLTKRILKFDIHYTTNWYNYQTDRRHWAYIKEDLLGTTAKALFKSKWNQLVIVKKLIGLHSQKYNKLVIDLHCLLMMNPNTAKWSVQQEVVMTLRFTPRFIQPVHSRRQMWSECSPIQILWQIKHPVTVDLILWKYNGTTRWISFYHASRFNTGDNKRTSVDMVLSQFYPTPIITTYLLQIHIKYDW